MPIIFILFVIFSNFAFAQKIPDAISLQNSKAIYVVDGDSVSLSMRIKGIDTPEKPQKCRKNPDKVINCGLIAKEYMQVLLDNIPGEIFIEPVAIGYYGRVLVNLYKGDINIGEMMVNEGMAYAYGNQYKKQEQYAKKNHKGFWGYDKPPLTPKIWRKRYGRKF